MPSSMRPECPVLAKKSALPFALCETNSHCACKTKTRPLPSAHTASVCHHAAACDKRAQRAGAERDSGARRRTSEGVSRAAENRRLRLGPDGRRGGASAAGRCAAIGRLSCDREERERQGEWERERDREREREGRRTVQRRKVKVVLHVALLS